jgi:hypothetical protein
MAVVVVYFKELSRHLTEGTKQNENISHNNLCRRRDSNHKSLECKSEGSLLPLESANSAFIFT